MSIACAQLYMYIPKRDRHVVYVCTYTYGYSENATRIRLPCANVLGNYVQKINCRTHRPHVELCRDPPMYGMVEEVAEISGAQHSLSEKLTTAV